MSFIFPYFLFSIVAIAVPIIIHLYNWRKYTRVLFPDISFLEHIVVTTKKYAQIQNWKLLLLRIAMIILLVLAFAQPFLNKKSKSNSSESISVIFDNSLSLSCTNGQKNYLLQQKEKAIDFLKQMPENVLINFVANDDYAEQISVKDVIEKIRKIDFAATGKNLVQLYDKLQLDTLNENKVIVFSDFQKPTFIPDSVGKQIDNHKSSFYFSSLARNEKANRNLYIDTAYFLDGVLENSQVNHLIIKVKSSDDKGFLSQLQIFQNGKVVNFSNIKVEDNGMYIDTVGLVVQNNDWQEITLVINDEVMPIDDTFRIAFRLSGKNSVASYYSITSNSYISAAFHSFAKLHYTAKPINTLKVSESDDNDILIIEDLQNIDMGLVATLKHLWEAGKHVVIIPNENINITNFNASLSDLAGVTLLEWDASSQNIDEINTYHSVLRPVFEKLSEETTKPRANKRLLLQAHLDKQPQFLMKFKDGNPFVMQCNVLNGLLTFINVPLQLKNTDFVISPYFAPLFYNLALQNNAQQIYVASMGDIEPLVLPNKGRDMWRILSTNEMIPQQNQKGKFAHIYLENLLKQPGFYSLSHPQDTEVYRFALNTNKKESLINYATNEEINALFTLPNKVYILSATTSVFATMQKEGISLWYVLLIILVLIFVMESILALNIKIKL